MAIHWRAFCGPLEARMPGRWDRADSSREDGLGAARGIVYWAVPAILFWAVIVAVIVWAV
jgi:hypothetical protein